MSECMTQEDAMNMSNEQAVAILKPLRDMMRDQYGFPISDAYFAVGKAIEALSQPQRIKGKWKRTKANSGYNAEWTCSNCGYTVYAEFCNLNFCSLCGAEMRGDEDAVD